MDLFVIVQFYALMTLVRSRPELDSTFSIRKMMSFSLCIDQDLEVLVAEFYPYGWSPSAADSPSAKK